MRLMSYSKIRILSDEAINKIAAGEVIENPASVVKELVENSIDAGATQICVEIVEGGRQLIRVTDNGSGMNKDDALLCLERHATSKIRDVEEIETLATMGFRGEAIPSIASISKFKILTRADQELGTLITLEGGKCLSCVEAARDPGTTMEVKSIFFNVPVRRKFQKSPSYDAGEILKWMGLFSLSYPEVQFELISDQQTLLKTPLLHSTPSFLEILEKRCASVLGKDYADSLIPLNFKSEPYEALGYIGLPSLHKSNRSGHQLFINRRAVTSPLIASAIREGYGTMLPSNRYPVFILHVNMPGTLLDVNVHPQKKEVRIRQEAQLKEAIIQAVQMALRGSNTHAEPSVPSYWASSPFDYPIKRAEEWKYEKNEDMPAPFLMVEETPWIMPAPPIVENTLFSKEKKQVPKVLGTIRGYCLLETFEGETDGFVLLDQKAAHARILYEQLLTKDKKPESQALLIPIPLQLSSSECHLLKEYLSFFNQMGFGLREFGEKTFLLDSLPAFFKEKDIQTCLINILHDLRESGSTRHIEQKKEERLAYSASLGALPSSQTLSLAEANALVQQLFSCDTPKHCPLGKPTWLTFTSAEIAKWF